MRTPEAVLQTLSRVVVKGAETEQSARLRDNFGIPNKPKNLADTRADWDRQAPAWIKAAVDLGISPQAASKALAQLESHLDARTL